MIISVQGDLIDTEKIYEISEIYEWIYEGKLAGYRFKIKYFNNQEKEVYTRIFPMVDNLKKEEIDALVIEHKESIEDLRNRIVEVWNKNQGDIPRFEFK